MALEEKTKEEMGNLIRNLPSDQAGANIVRILAKRGYISKIPIIQIEDAIQFYERIDDPSSAGNIAGVAGMKEKATDCYIRDGTIGTMLVLAVRALENAEPGYD